MTPPVLLVGSHFTTAENWERIEHEGLLPYTLKQDFAPYFIQGVLIWTDGHDLESEIGTAMFQGWTKNTTDVVQLRVEYTVADVMPPKVLRPRDSVALTHNGTYPDGTPYHRKKPIRILRSVPAEQVSLVACYYVPRSPW